jgi:hypothetical protein
MAIKLNQYALYLLPSDDRSPTQEIVKEANAVDLFLTELLTFLDAESSVRKFFFPNDREPEARAKILELPEKKTFDLAVSVLATRLYEKQRAAEVGVIKVQDGDFLTVLYESHGSTHVLLAKLEQMNFLSRGTWQRDSGFPFDEKRLLKTCLCELNFVDGKWEVGEVSIYDSNSTVSRFWWDDFLELTELTNDARNSQRAYAAWKSMLEVVVKPKSKLDYHILQNMVGYYFRSPNNYIHKDAVASLLGSYKPEDPSLNVVALRDRAEKLADQSAPLDKRFDERFTIDPKACNVRLRPIRLTPEIDLVLKKPLEHLVDVVKRATIDGKEGVFVVSPEGYRQLSTSQA